MWYNSWFENERFKIVIVIDIDGFILRRVGGIYEVSCLEMNDRFFLIDFFFNLK